MCCQLTKPITDIFGHLLNQATIKLPDLRKFKFTDYNNLVGIYPKTIRNIICNHQLANSILLDIFNALKSTGRSSAQSSISIDTEWCYNII